MRRILILFSVFLAMLTVTVQPVLAQDAVTPEKITLVKRYFTAMEMEKTIDGMMKSVMPMMVNQQRAQNPKMTEAEAKALGDSVVETMAEITPIYLDKLVETYAATFTQEELTQLVAFYESSVGKSVITKSQALTQKTVDVMMTLMPELESRMVIKLCAKIDCKAAK